MIAGNKNKIISFIEDVISSKRELSEVKSLRINRRKPYTDRLFFFIGDDRVCLHIFQPCESHEAFPHPHSWESEVQLLKGKYKHWMIDDVDLDSDASPYFKSLTPTILGAESSYSIKSPMTWHKVQPLTECWTIMINKPMWQKDEISSFCKFTKGKELVSIPDDEKLDKLTKFLKLLK